MDRSTSEMLSGASPIEMDTLQFKNHFIKH